MYSILYTMFFMTEKTHEQKRNRRKLPNYFLQFKSGFICQHNKTFSRLIFRSLTQDECFCCLPNQKN